MRLSGRTKATATGFSSTLDIGGGSHVTVLPSVRERRTYSRRFF